MYIGLVIILIVIIFYIYNTKLAHPNLNIVLYDEIKNKVKTGDLICFHSLDNVNSLFIGSYWTHIGIVYRAPGKEPQLFEAFNYSRMPIYPKECDRGIVLCDLEHRLKTYRGFVVWRPLINPIDPKFIPGFENFIDYALKNMEYDTNVMRSGLAKIFLGEAPNTFTNCGEIVYLSMIKLGLLPYKAGSFFTHYLRYVSSLTYIHNNRYLDGAYIYNNYFVGVKI